MTDIIPLAIRDTLNPIVANLRMKPKRIRIKEMDLISWQMDNPTIAPVQFMQLLIQNMTPIGYNLVHNMHEGMVAVPYQTGTMWTGSVIKLPIHGDIDTLDRLIITVYREGATPIAVVPAVNYSISFLFYLYIDYI